MTSPHAFDAITVESLRRTGSLKWSLFPDALGAFVAEMDFGTAPVITEALHTAVDEAVFGYLPPRLAADLAQACADWHGTAYGWDLAPEQVHPVADVVRAFEMTIEHFSRPGSAVIVPTPAYMPFLTVPPALGRRVIEVPLLVDDAGRHHLDLDGVAAAYRAGGHLLVLCNPCNPVGKVFDAPELEALAAVVATHHGRVFSDEIHAPLVYAGARHLPYASVSAVTAGHTVTATSAAKAWNLPGLKCAQLILSAEADVERWARVGALAGHGASNLGVIAATVAYRAGRPWLDDVVDYLDGSRSLLADLVTEHLPEVGFVPPQGTYIAWLDCRALGLDAGPADFFRERAGVALTDGAACGAAGQGFVRFVFATPRPVLEQAVVAMGAAVRSSGQRLAG